MRDDPESKWNYHKDTVKFGSNLAFYALGQLDDVNELYTDLIAEANALSSLNAEKYNTHPTTI
jgi:hypothetical protein